jgi:hypothetical protein
MSFFEYKNTIILENLYDKTPFKEENYGIVTVSNLKTLRVGSIVKFKIEEESLNIVHIINTDDMFLYNKYVLVNLFFMASLICISIYIKKYLTNFYSKNLVIEKKEKKTKSPENSDSPDNPDSPENSNITNYNELDEKSILSKMYAFVSKYRFYIGIALATTILVAGSIYLNSHSSEANSLAVIAPVRSENISSNSELITNNLNILPAPAPENSSFESIADLQKVAIDEISKNNISTNSTGGSTLNFLGVEPEVTKEYVKNLKKEFTQRKREALIKKCELILKKTNKK